MRISLFALFVAGTFPLISCTPKDPDLDPKPTGPAADSRQTPWNAPLPGQGGGALGALPQQPRR